MTKLAGGAAATAVTALAFVESAVILVAKAKLVAVNFRVVVSDKERRVPATTPVPTKSALGSPPVMPRTAVCRPRQTLQKTPSSAVAAAHFVADTEYPFVGMVAPNVVIVVDVTFVGRFTVIVNVATTSAVVAVVVPLPVGAAVVAVVVAPAVDAAAAAVDAAAAAVVAVVLPVLVALLAETTPMRARMVAAANFMFASSLEFLSNKSLLSEFK